MGGFIRKILSQEDIDSAIEEILQSKNIKHGLQNFFVDKVIMQEDCSMFIFKVAAASGWVNNFRWRDRPVHVFDNTVRPSVKIRCNACLSDTFNVNENLKQYFKCNKCNTMHVYLGGAISLYKVPEGE